MTRRSTRAEFEEKLDRARALQAQGLSDTKIMEETDMSPSVFYRHLGKHRDPNHPPLYAIEGGASIRRRILEALERKRFYATPGEILLDIRRPDENLDIHKVSHVIWALQKVGKITFKESKTGLSGTDVSILSDIRLRRPADMRKVHKVVDEILNAKPIAHGKPDEPPRQNERPEYSNLLSRRINWPHLDALWLRGKKIKSAMALLRSAGYPNLAEDIYNETFTDQEKEMLEYLEIVHYVPHKED